MSGKGQLIGAAFIGIPTLFFLIGLWMFADTVSFLSNSIRTTGEVVAVEVKRTGPGKQITELRNTNSLGSLPSMAERRVYDESYVPTLRFDALGTMVEAPTHISADIYDYEIGAEVPIRYLPEDLSEVRIAGILSLWAFPVVFTFLGGGMLVLVWFGRGQLREKLARM